MLCIQAWKVSFPPVMSCEYKYHMLRVVSCDRRQTDFNYPYEPSEYIVNE